METPSKRARIGAWVLSGMVILFALMDAGLKLAAPQVAIDNSPPIGWPADLSSYRLLGITLIVPTLLYALPRTAVIGAILLTGYFGGTVAIHIRAGSPLFSHILFGVYLGIMTWGGLWLREPRLRALLPLTR